MINQFLSKIKQFRFCQQGMALIEFAIIFPLMMSLLIGMVEITNYVFAYNKAEQASSALANIIVRGDLSQSQLDDLLVAVHPLMEPFDFNQSGNGVFVTAFGVDQSTGDPEILWTRSYMSPGSGITTEELANRITMDAARDETVITVQVFYKFQPMMTSFLFDGGEVDVNTFALAIPRDDPMKTLDP